MPDAPSASAARRWRLDYPGRAVLLLCLLLAPWPATAADTRPAELPRDERSVSAPLPPAPGGLARYGTPKYPADFAHFDYADPGAPKAGELRLYQIGTFDSLNPFAGVTPTARGANPMPVDLLGLTTDSLLAASADEPASAYPLLAQSVTFAPDHRSVTFVLREIARFHDGSPVTAEDVLFSIQMFKDHGLPAARAGLRRVESGEKIDARTIRFALAPRSTAEVVLALGRLPILSRADWQERPLSRLSLDAPLGSGPYRVESLEAGRGITLVRVADYWGQDLPVNRGLFNFDRIRTQFYPDQDVALVGFRSHDYDVRYEAESRKWATAYKQGRRGREAIRLISFANQRPQPMQGLVFNLRRPLWQDRRLRQAISEAFDFQKVNKSLLFGQYSPTRSYFANSPLAAEGPPDAAEKDLLDRMRISLPPEAATEAFSLPTPGDSRGRHALNQAITGTLGELGWTRKRGRLVDGQGHILSFAILLDDAKWEPLCKPFVDNLRKIGIEARLDLAEPPLFSERLNAGDFDMAVHRWPRTDLPGEELRDLWGSAAADRPGSGNRSGLKDEGIDRLIEELLASPDMAALTTRTRALDRALLWGYYAVPQWYMAADHVAIQGGFGMPDVQPASGGQVLAWWSLAGGNDVVADKERKRP